MNESTLHDYIKVTSKEDFEIRLYSALSYDSILSSAKAYKELANSGFNKLVNYIFKTSDVQEIPVYFNPYENNSPQEAQLNFPIKTERELNRDQQTEKQNSDRYVAVLKFGGFASDEIIQSNLEKLEKALKLNIISYYGKFHYLGYNNAYQLFGRKNEIIICVNWDPNATSKLNGV